MEEEVLEEFVRTLSKDPTLTEEEIKKLAAKKFLDVGNRSRAWYRVNATRNMTGGRRIDIEIDEKLKEVTRRITKGGQDRQYLTASCG